MLSASDLVSFAAAHLRDGEGLNGARLLSAESARLMRTSTSRLKGFGTVREFGLGWMLSANGTIGHGGGGPGILSRVSADRDKDYAIAVLTNAGHGSGLIRDTVNTWSDQVAALEPVEIPSYPFTGEAVDSVRFLGNYAGIAGQHDVVEHDGGIGFGFYRRPPVLRQCAPGARPGGGA